MTENIQGIVYKLLHPKKIYLLIIDVFSILILTFIFTQSFNDTAFAYIIYLFSAYSLIATFIYLYNLTESLRNKILGNRHINKYNVNIHYHMKIKLYSSATINILYAIFKLTLGILYQSLWEIHIGVYYFIICIVRIILLRQVNYSALGKNKAKEYEKYRLCGYFLIVLNIILCGMVILMVLRNYTYDYHGYIIYIAAIYTFYTTFSAVVAFVKNRKHDSPLIDAANTICFMTALVSVLSLQTAMLTQFGTESLSSKQMMNGITGSMICIIIFLASIYMIKHARKEIINTRARI